MKRMLGWLVVLVFFHFLNMMKGVVAVKTLNESFCERKWPSLELFLPVGLSHKIDDRSVVSRNEEWQWCFLSSFMMFWPAKISNTSILLMIDEEAKNSTLKVKHVDNVLERLKDSPNLPSINIKYHVKTIEYNNGGHDRQQHMMFYADQYTTAEYVGFVDTDTLFYTALDREDIFEDGKPVVHGKIGVMPTNNWYHRSWAKATYNAMGLEEPMLCMSYFPMVIKTAHLKPLRDHIAKHYNLPFDETIAKYAGNQKGTFSQFNFMCTFMWTFHRNDYAWRIDDISPNWNGVWNPKPEWGQWSMRYIFSSDMLVHKPFISLHARYYNAFRTLFDLGEKTVYLRGICHGEGNRNVIGLDCTDYLKTHDIFDEMHMFEGLNFIKTANRSELIHLQRERQVRLKHCDKTYGHHEMLKVFSPLDETSKLKHQAMLLVEKDVSHMFPN